MGILIRDAVFTSVLVIVFQVLLQKGNTKQKLNIKHMLGVLVFSNIMVIIFDITGVNSLTGFHWDWRMEGANFIPFMGIYHIIIDAIKYDQSRIAFLNIVGNIFLFMPIGFFMPLLWRRFQNMRNTVLCGLVVSCLIEFSQMFLLRSTDVDDVMLNTFGALLGYGVYTIAIQFFPKLAQVLICEAPMHVSVQLRKYIPYVSILTSYVIVVLFGVIDGIRI